MDPSIAKRNEQTIAARANSEADWQEDFFDHLLSSHESYAEKWNYSRYNPVRAGLVKTAESGRMKAKSAAFHFRNGQLL